MQTGDSSNLIVSVLSLLYEALLTSAALTVMLKLVAVSNAVGFPATDPCTSLPITAPTAGRKTNTYSKFKSQIKAAELLLGKSEEEETINSVHTWCPENTKL